MKQTFYSHGKLLITGEYLVVDGATALAVPTKFGQDLQVEFKESDSFTLQWQSLDTEGKVWFSSSFVVQEAPIRSGGVIRVFEPTDNSDMDTALNLARLLTLAFKLKGDFKKGHLEIKTHLEFPQDWGLGSSSTLISNIAQWLDINVYELFFSFTKGSGYDLACAQEDASILYTRQGNTPKIENVEWNPIFKDDLCFVHLGQKQKSDKEVRRYSELIFNKESAIERVNAITHSILNCKNLSEFETLVEEHEEMLSSVLKRPTVKDSLFSDYKGAVKSLGAWGGDFVLVTKRPGFESYFKEKGFDTILFWENMIFFG